LDITDKMTKLRPLMDRLNHTFMMAYPKDQQMDLDEAMKWEIQVFREVRVQAVH